MMHQPSHHSYTTHLLRHTRAVIGRNIHAARARQKLPLHRLAKLADVPPGLLDHYELGKNEISLDHLLRLACALQIDIKTLLT